MEPLITVISATAFKIDTHAEAVERTMRCIPVPCCGVVVSNKKPNSDRVYWEEIPSHYIPSGEWDRGSYSKFMVEMLHEYVRTPWCITAQWDGYAINHHLWSDSFLEYDYIGAPWPISWGVPRVGNGGFSLRSKRWLQKTFVISKANPIEQDAYGVEDCYQLWSNRDLYLEDGLKIAPVDIAMRFSYEKACEDFQGWDATKSFAFHGFFEQSNEIYRITEPS